MTRFEELLEGYLAGALSLDEEREFAALLALGDNRRTLDAHRRTAALLNDVDRHRPSPSFTEEVLARLPERAPGFWERARDLFFAQRTLRWNLASALALGLLLVAAPVIVKTLTGRAPVGPEPRPAVTLFRFSLNAPGAERVSLAGDFNGWRTDEILLSDTTGRGNFSVTLPLKPGRYAYMFIVDGTTWVTDPRAEAYRDDGFGNQNALVTVEDARGDNGAT